MDKLNKIYLVRNEESEDPAEHFWEQYDSLDDAVCSGHDLPVEVFEASPKYLGHFKRSNKIVKVKKK